MEIEYFCFSDPNLHTTDDVITKEDSENTIWIKTKDKELREAAKEKGMCIVFDRTTKKFYKDNVEFDVRNKVIFPRSHIAYESELITSIIEHGGIPIQTMEDHDKITLWPNFFGPVHRKMVVTTYGEFQKNADSYRTAFQRIFIKTAIKSHTRCVLKYFGTIEIDGKPLFFTKPPLWDMALSDIVFLSEVFESIKDPENDMNCREYRVFVVDDSILSISRSYVDYETQVPEQVTAFAELQIKRISKIEDFPSSYVLDIGQVLMEGKEVIDIIELNPICSSGLEVSNHLVDEILKRRNRPKQLVKK